MNVTVIGLGYVGLTNASVLASFGHDVIGYDINESKIKALKSGIPTINEPGLLELMKANRERLHFTSSLEECFKDTEVVVVAVDTPEKEDGSCDLSRVSMAIQMIVENVKDSVTIVMKSTVPVGTNRKIKEIIARKSKHPIYIASNPEFLSQGQAIDNMMNPWRIIVGTDQPEAHISITVLFEEYYRRGIPIYFTSFESAELIKYAANNFLALKISFINEMALLCDKVGADIDMVSKGIGLDPRIGKDFLNAGIGYGGSCFPKDTKALNWMATQKDEPLETIKATININKKMPKVFINKIVKRFNGNLSNVTIAALGLSFKGTTNDVRNSQSIEVVSSLLKLGAKVVAYDYQSENEFSKVIGKHPNLKYAISLSKALQNADAVAILNDAKEFKNLKVEDYKKMMKKTPIIFDGRNLYSLQEFEDVEYYSIGRPKIHRYKEDGPYKANKK